METKLKKTYCKVTRQVTSLFGTLWAVEIGEKDNETGISCTSNPFTLHEFLLPGRLDWYAVWTRWILLIHYELSRPFDQVHNSSSPKSKTAEEVAYQLIDIFFMFGASFILQSDNGREFANKIIQNLTDMWPGMKLVHGKPRYSQTQGSVERSNQDVRDKLVAWMSDSNTKTWSEGLRFVQSKKIRALHSGIKTSPYEVMFGTAQRIGLEDSPLTEDMYSSIGTEELEQLFNAGTNNGRDKKDKEEANQQYRKDEDENQTNDT